MPVRNVTYHGFWFLVWISSLKVGGKHDAFGLSDFDFRHLFHLSISAVPVSDFKLKEEYVNMLSTVGQEIH